MELQQKPDFEEARARWRAYWAGEVMDRPPVTITVPRDPARRVPCPAKWSVVTNGLEKTLSLCDEFVASTHFLAEAVPAYYPSWGPDQFAGLLGAEIVSAIEREGTTWAIPFVEDWQSVLPIRLDGENALWQEVQRFYRLAGERGDGKFLCRTLDLHVGPDALAAIRGPERLCMDLHDVPAAVHRALADVRPLVLGVYDRLFDLAKMGERGSMHGDFYCEGRFDVLQSDFSYMVSPAMFREFVLPSLEDQAHHLDHAAFHVDGMGVLRHLDDIMAIEGVDVIQWVPGAGNKPLFEWMDLFERVQRAGKGLQLGGLTTDQIKETMGRLRPEGLFFPSVRVDSLAEAEKILAWMKAHT